MAVTTQQSRYQFACNGSTVSFAFPALIYNATELTVLGLDSGTGLTTTYVLNTDYTIDPSEIGEDTGVNVVFGTAPASTVTLTIFRLVPNTQVLELVEGAKLPSIALEQSLDELEFQIQQVADQLARITLPPATQTIGNPVRLASGAAVVFDLSANGVPQIGITPCNIRDSTGGTIITPTIGGTPVNENPAPLVIGDSDTVAYFSNVINATTGAMVSSSVLTGTSIPSDTTTMSYQKICDLVVTVADGVATVVPSGNIAGSQNYFYCGVLPAVDGSGHLYNS